MQMPAETTMNALNNLNTPSEASVINSVQNALSEATPKAASRTTQNVLNKEEIVAAIRECAERLGHAPSTRELKELSGIQRKAIASRFGTYALALEACGLKRQDKQRPYTMRELFDAWAAVARTVNRVPTMYEFQSITSIASKSLMRRFGKWAAVSRGMLAFLEREKLEGEWGDVAELVRLETSGSQLEGAFGSQWWAGAVREPMSGREGTLMSKLPPEVQALVKAGEPVYGEPIFHPAMSHAPVNEAGVMVLFGALARDLGFLIMRMQSAFPDCEAMRKLPNGRWQRLLIELEFESRNFKEHLHDRTGCDLIVCWVHNWPECPVPVIELGALFGK